jgi:cell division septal protein FtsQ
VSIGKILVALVVALIIIFVGLYTLALWQSYIMDVLEKSLGI